MPEIKGEIVTLRPLRDDDAAVLRVIHLEPAVAAWWGSMDDEFPFDEPESTRFTIWVEDEIAGLVQYGEEDEPDYRHAWIDIFVATAHHSRGVGTDAVKTMVRYLAEQRGHHRITIDPTLENKAAIRAYEKAGFERVGVLRLAERSPEGVWRDSLLMEQVFPSVAGLTSGQEFP